MSKDDEVKESGRIEIVVQSNGQMTVGWSGLPQDSVILYGLLEAAKDAVRRQFAPKIVQASSANPFGLMNGRS